MAKPNRPTGLGRGLEALLPKRETPADVVDVPVGDVRPNPYQPREDFDEAEIATLAASIKRHGLLQPIVVRRVDDGFEVVAGERRLRAAKVAGLKTIRAVVAPESPDGPLALALAENVLRRDLNPVELSQAINQLASEFKLSHSQIGEMLGLERPTVANLARLVKLSANAKKALVETKISLGHAKVLLALDKEQQDEALERIIGDKLRVRATEPLVRVIRAKKAKAEAEKPRDVYIREQERRLQDGLGTKVRIKGDAKRGRIVIEYFSLEDLNRILDLIINSEGL